MSRTRHADEEAELSQKRFYSVPEFNHALLATAVAKRAQLVADPELRDLLWFLHARCHEAGFGKKKSEVRHVGLTRLC